MKLRVGILLVFFLAITVGLVMRAFYVQVLPNERLHALKQKQFATIITLQPRRGDILDRNGAELAISITAHSLFADPQFIEKPKATSRKLACLLGEPVAEIYEKIKNPQHRFVWIARRLSNALHHQILDLHIKGLDFVEEPKRIYPNDHMMAQTIGYVGADGRGLDGLEHRFDQELAGDSKTISFQRDARGRPLIINGKIFSELPDGQTLELTIDREIQYNLEQELQQAITEHEADAATGIVLDAQTSEILAISSLPTFNPNLPQSAEADQKRNRAVTDPIEPGSTLKTFTIAAGLKEQAIAPNTQFYCEKGLMKMGKRTVKEADKKHAFTWLTVNEILQHSSNIGAAKIGLKLGDSKLRQSLAEFGFGERLGPELSGESRGILPSLPWRDHMTATISFGHSVAVTPLQIASAYAMIANGGTLKRPHILRAIRSRDGLREPVADQNSMRRVLNPRDALTLKYMLMAATSEDGTGLRARVAGFQVAGKTGTAQKPNFGKKGYLANAYISSFAGFLPAHDPRFVIYIAIDHPRKGYYGADVAAPVFSKVAEFAIRRTGLVPNLLSEKDVDPALLRIIKGDLKSATVAPAAPLLPTSNTPAAVATGVTDESPLPDLKGLTLREALRRLRSQGLDADPVGHGVVSESEPTAGRQIRRGSQVRLYLKETSEP